MKPVLAAAALAVAFPGTALGAGLVQQRELQPQAGRRVLATGTYQLVGLHWRGTGVVRYRTRALSGHWSRWRVSADEDALPNRGREIRALRGWRIGEPVWTGASEWLEYRTVGRVTRVRAVLVRSPRVRGRLKRAEIAGAPPIVMRAGWRADESIRRGAPYYADGIHLAFVHHTAGSNVYSKSQSASIVRAIELYHVQGNGWNDIGYNFLVDKYGQIFEGRYGGMTRPVVGAHSMGFNSGSVGVALIGDYGSSAVTPAARAALVSLLAWRLDLAHADPLSSVVRVSAGNPRHAAGRPVTLRTISGHRDVYPTSCPGASLYAELPSLRTAVSRAGLPKLYAPAVTGKIGGSVRFTARLSSTAQWTVTVRDAAGATAASGTGTGTRVDWTWDASAAAATRYTWAITAPRMRAATGSIGSTPVPLSLQQLRVTPTIVSPNGDDRGDDAKIGYRLSAAAAVTATVQDALGATVATLFSGERIAGKQELTWNPEALNDGWYRVVVVAASAGKQVQAATRFWIDRTLAGGKASRTAFSPNGDGILDRVGVSFQLLNAAHVRVRVFRGSTAVGTLLEQDLQPGARRLSWDGSGLPDGRYSIRISAADSLLEVTQAVSVTIDRRRPSLRLVSLQSRLFRVSEPGRVMVVVNGRRYWLGVRRAGPFHFAYRGTVHRLAAYAVDLAGNRSLTISARR